MEGRDAGATTPGARSAQWRGVHGVRSCTSPATNDTNSMATTSWQPTTLVKCVSVRPWLVYPGCDEPGGCHDLTLGKIYENLGVEGSGSFYRIIDDSGDDYLYPVSHFRPL
jgi:hypothetical protein